MKRKFTKVPVSALSEPTSNTKKRKFTVKPIIASKYDQDWGNIVDRLKADQDAGNNPIDYQTPEGEILIELCSEVEGSIGMDLEPSTQGGQGVIEIFSDGKLIAKGIDYERFNNDTVNIAIECSDPDDFKASYKNLLRSYADQYSCITNLPSDTGAEELVEALWEVLWYDDYYGLDIDITPHNYRKTGADGSTVEFRCNGDYAAALQCGGGMHATLEKVVYECGHEDWDEFAELIQYDYSTPEEAVDLYEYMTNTELPENERVVKLENLDTDEIVFEM